MEIGNGQLKIVKEGNIIKFANNIEQISFNGQLALEDNKNVYYITERAVFKLTHEGLELIEIAPGVDLQKDVLNQMEYKPIIKDVKLMPAEIFNEQWGGLAEIMDSHTRI